MFKRLGEKKFDALVFRAHTAVKLDEKAIYLGLKMEMEKMNRYKGLIEG